VAKKELNSFEMREESVFFVPESVLISEILQEEEFPPEILLRSCQVLPVWL
jgi:hypothetical protein